MMRIWTALFAGIAIVIALLPCTAPCQNPPEVGACAGARALIDKGQYAEGLKIVEEAIKGAP